MNKIKAIFIHGNGGSTGNDNWMPSVARDLETQGLQVIRKTFPDNQLARGEYWLPYIKELGADENTILIGHSSGAVAAMRFAEQHKIFGTVLVSASYTDLGEENEKVSGYFDMPWSWEKIRQNQKFIIQFASTDDPYIPISEARHIHDQLQTEYHEFSDKGHFGWDKGIKEFPELVAALKAHLSSV
jgi:predicted alpha/beta hydrolase family esterase